MATKRRPSEDGNDGIASTSRAPPMKIEIRENIEDNTTSPVNLALPVVKVNNEENGTNGQPAAKDSNGCRPSVFQVVVNGVAIRVLASNPNYAVNCSIRGAVHNAVPHAVHGAVHSAFHGVNSGSPLTRPPAPSTGPAVRAACAAPAKGFSAIPLLMPTSGRVTAFVNPANLRKRFDPHLDIRLRPIPFYDDITEVIRPFRLVETEPTFTEKFVRFQFSYGEIDEINSACIRNGNNIVKFRKQVLLRFFIIDSTREQDDCYPPGLQVKVNGYQLLIPGIPGNARELEITRYLNFYLNQTNSIYIRWKSYPFFQFGACVKIVRRLTPEEVLEKLLRRARLHRNFVKGLVVNKLLPFSPALVDAELRASPLCPIVLRTMTYPCRSISCDHLQCFDALFFLRLYQNENKNLWTCPVCKKRALFEDLAIDGYFEEILKSPFFPPGTREITFWEDGSWAPTDHSQGANNANVSNIIVNDDGDDDISDNN